jgi:hypothetical protein
MALTTYTAGEVLTAASLNDNFTFAASNPPASPAGLAFITGAAFTTATSVSLPNSTFTSTYRNYRVIFQTTATTSDADITLRLRASGSDVSSANYDFAWAGFTTGNAASSVGAAVTTSFDVGEIDTGFPFNQIVLDVLQPQLATTTFILGQLNYANKAGTAVIVRNGGGFFRLTTQFDALTLISSVASSITGAYRVYGYADS